jgi:hypothetical protein
MTILGHHGGELPLLPAALGSAGAVSVLLLLLRSDLGRLGRRLRRRRTAGATDEDQEAG